MTAEQAATVEESIKKHIVKITRNKDVVIAPATTFKDLGADSLDIVQVLMALEEQYKVELMDDELKAITNLGDLTNYVTKKVAARKD